ncbi:hypothetical protein FACS189444_2980 [Spirochaetia bacterium]|nr:hypothetical protein FACS189444_2980 [Spirochaetia bacterium]
MAGIATFLKNNSYSVFPYEFINKYNTEDVVVYHDNGGYVLHDNKKLYFPKSWNDAHIQKYYCSLLMDQDIESPHRYEYNDFSVQDGDVVIDAGAAEGIFALSVIERAKKVYLVECNSEWFDALEMTFAPWQDRIVIVSKYISDKSDDTSVTLDELAGDETVNFIKADIEGAEYRLLTGGKKTLSVLNNLRIALCVYHKKSDAQDLSRILTENSFDIEFSKGYMLTGYSPPYLRKGLIRAVKSSQ